MAFALGHGRNSGRLFLSHSRDVARPITRLLLHEPGRPCPGSFFRGAPAVSNAVEVEHALFCIHRTARGIRSR